ncbi:zinc finger and BTB domain-containing protein 24-like [Wyeomyia smithii]|uniref:zinc finger and BTB domain-containing protein 24-like n=1 Tax=Wyeomyia smithii TaxID=174621 RepID=UPI002467EB93|nr:zinc finger and BTB domain-containing protein 24-like [Wyeomyia smithii]
MDSLNQPMNIAEYNNLITNIIESAVDELIQKRESSGVTLGYDNGSGISGHELLLLNICRLCAKEEPRLLDLSELHLILIAELSINGIESSVGCTKICPSCAEFLGRIREFRYRCEEAQKRIGLLLTERNVISDFLNLNFTKQEEHYEGFSPPPDSQAEKPASVMDAFNDLASSSSEQSEPEIPPVPKPVRKTKREKKSIKKGDLKTLNKQPDSRRRVVNGKLQWVCLDCEEVFQSCTKLKKHRQTCKLVGTENSKRLGSFTCEICGQTLPSLMGLRVHLHKHSKARLESDSKSKEEPKSPPPVPKKAVCHVCGKAFNGASSLRSHLVFHDQEKRMECPVCKKKFFKLYRLKDHMNCHTNVRRYSCTICGKAFFTKGILYKHTRLHEQNFRKHQCSICPMRFPHPYQLRSHMMIHTAEYPHGCKLCPSKFRFSWDLKKHIAKSHPPLLEEECGTLPEAASALPQPLEELIAEPLLQPSLLALEPLSPPPHTDPTVMSLMEEEQQHDDLSVMLADIPPHQQSELTPSLAAVQPVLAEHPFDTDNLLDDASRDFTSDCFPSDHHLNGGHHAGPDDDFYSFMEC